MLDHLHLFLLVASVVIFFAAVVILSLLNRQKKTGQVDLTNSELEAAERQLEKSGHQDYVMLERFSSINGYAEKHMVEYTIKLSEKGYQAIYVPFIGPDGIGTNWKIEVPVEFQQAAYEELQKLKDRHLSLI